MSARRPTSRGLARTLCAFLVMAAAFAGPQAREAGVGDGAVETAHGTYREPASHADEHAHHRVHMDTGHTRSLANYDIPALTLVDASGREVSLAGLLDGGKPLMLNFIFTSCTTICPVQTATFSQVQAALGELQNQVRMVSISIDPEQDTPARLSAYAAKFHAGLQWRFLTGSVPDILAVQKAFDAYRGEKASHVPLTFLHASPGAPWVRIEGFISAAELLHEYRTLVAQR